MSETESTAQAQGHRIHDHEFHWLLARPPRPGSAATVGQRLPDRHVEQADGSTAWVGANARDGTIVLVPHEHCEPCQHLHDTVQERAEMIGWWGARPVTTHDARLRPAIGLAPGEAAVIVLDRFGVIWERHTAPSDDHHALPDVDGVEESAKYLGTQCPECGVPDHPYTGQWTTL